MEKLFTSKAFLKMTGRRTHTPHPTPLDPPLAISYGNYQKSLAYLRRCSFLHRRILTQIRIR